MTDEYRPGKGPPIKVDPTGRSNKTESYDPEIHGYAIVMCSKPFYNCHNDEVYVKDYEAHLSSIHHRRIDPVQDRLMKSAAMIKPSLRKSKYVWAPFPEELSPTIYEMHMWNIAREQADGN